MINPRSAKIAAGMKKRERSAFRTAPLRSPERARSGNPSAATTEPKRALQRSSDASLAHAERGRKLREAAAGRDQRWPGLSASHLLSLSLFFFSCTAVSREQLEESFRPAINRRSKQLVARRPVPPRSMSKEQELAVVQCARWVAQYGESFEGIVAAKNADNPLFAFLTERSGTDKAHAATLKFFAQRKSYEKFLTRKAAAAALASKKESPKKSRASSPPSSFGTHSSPSW